MKTNVVRSVSSELRRLRLNVFDFENDWSRNHSHNFRNPVLENINLQKQTLKKKDSRGVKGGGVGEYVVAMCFVLIFVRFSDIRRLPSRSIGGRTRPGQTQRTPVRIGRRRTRRLSTENRRL